MRRVKGKHEKEFFNRLKSFFEKNKEMNPSALADAIVEKHKIKMSRVSIYDWLKDEEGPRTMTLEKWDHISKFIDEYEDAKAASN